MFELERCAGLILPHLSTRLCWFSHRLGTHYLSPTPPQMFPVVIAVSLATTMTAGKSFKYRHISFLEIIRVSTTDHSLSDYIF